jgi:mannose-1-phosphate guanylyltransferase
VANLIFHKEFKQLAITFMMKAVILAGGLGTRLRPVTYEIPKPLIPIRGKTLTEHNIDCLKDAGVDEIYLAIGYMAEKIQKHFGDGRGFGLTIHYIIEKEQLGTGGWMHLIPRIEDDFFVVNGDNLLNMDLNELMKFHRTHNAAATIALTKVEDVRAFGIARLDGEKIIGFVEKPKPEDAPSNYANSGFYVFSPKVFNHIPKAEKFMLEMDLFPMLARDGQLYGLKTDCQWFDTGTFERWEKVIMEWKK